MKFFVYANKTDVKSPRPEDDKRAIYFVPEDMMLEWSSKYIPSIMEFCGVYINAADREEAKSILFNPLENDGFEKMIVTEEPIVTRLVTERFMASKEKVNTIALDLMATRLATLWGQIDELLLGMAALYVLDNNDLTETEVYRRLKKEWINKYKGL